MISSMSVPARLAEPAVGAGFDAGRLSRAIDNCGTVCRVLQAEGLRPLHHSHVGGIFETEYEITRLLDDLGPDVISEVRMLAQQFAYPGARLRERAAPSFRSAILECLP